jgi:solute:Na+ symporter, SSS family
MQLHYIDIAIIILYLITTICIGYYVSNRASKDIQSYFLGGNSLPWYYLGVSNASGMFDIAGTMLLVYWLFVYGMKSVWIPWVWPVFNQIFLMVYLSVWLRRSNVMTGAEWIRTRFGNDRGANLSHIIVVVFALVSVIGFLAYGFKGIGKFATSFLPALVTNPETLIAHPQINANLWALILMGITTFYVVKGGMFSVVITEVIQYLILTISAIAIGIIAMVKVAPGTIDNFVPVGWKDIFFTHGLGIDWSLKISALNDWIISDGYSLFSIFFMMMLFKGIFVSAAGPAPNYDMQRILSTRNPKEAAKMSSLVSVVLNPFRYFMVAGLTLLALVNFSDVFKNIPAGTKPDFETLLPQVLAQFVPIGLLGFLMAGLIAAFMSNFAATVNAAPAYIINDIYKRYINPNAAPKKYVHLSYIASIAVVIVGITMGFFVDKINNIVLWITSALWGGYTASNVLKWYWWRFNGFGYFWGMVAGILSAILLSGLLMFNTYCSENQIHIQWLTTLSNFISGWPLPNNPNMNAFPYIFVLSILGCFIGTYVTKPEEPEVLKKFYSTVRPWGFWKPVHEMVIAENPNFKKNTNFLRDMFNVAVGIVWQITLVAMPIYLVIRMKSHVLVCIAILAVTSFILYKTWYRKLED